VVEERDRDVLDDRQLWLLAGVGREVLGAEQPEQELRAQRDAEEGIGGSRVGSSCPPSPASRAAPRSAGEA